MEGALAVDDLPHAWNEGMHRLLGLDVPDDGQGVLQDVHWGAGMIGYFPTYSLGNLMAAQLWDGLSAELPDVGERLERGDFAPLREWLHDRVHVHGRKLSPPELLRRATGQELAVAPFLDYLRAKLRDAGVLRRRGLSRGGRPRKRAGGLFPRCEREVARRVASKRTCVRRFRPRSPYTGSCVPAGPDRRHGRPRAQPQGRHRRHAARRARGHHGPVRLGQVVARVRHDLRRGPAPLRRVAERLRPPVPGADGQAGRRLDRGPVARDLDRPEDDLAQPALDGRHRDGDLRLPAPAVGARRQAALLQLRPADRGAVGRADHRPDHEPGGRHAVHGPGPDRARPQGRVRQAVRGAARGGLHPRQGGRRDPPARRADRARQEVQARHLGRGRPADHEAGRAQAAGRLGRDRGRARGRDPRDRDAPARRRRGAGADLLRALRVPALRDLDARARAADLLLQLTPRRLPALHRAGVADGDRSGARRARPVAVDRRGRDPPVGERGDDVLRPDHAGDRGALRDRPRRGLVRPAGGAAGPVPVRHERRPDLRHLPQPDGAQALLHDELRGHRPQPRAALQGDRLRLVAGEDRGVHDDAARARSAAAPGCAPSRARSRSRGCGSTSSRR